MKIVVQRVLQASVTANGRLTGEFGAPGGLVALVGIGRGDDATLLDWAANKLCQTRIFDEDDGSRPWQVSLAQSKERSIMLVSQFTLFAINKGNKLDFHHAAKGDVAEPLFDELVRRVRAQLAAVPGHTGTVCTGQFGADMKVALVNDGPVTVVFEREVARDDDVV